MLSNRIKQFREYNKFSVDFVAEMLRISPELYKKYESGEAEPDTETINLLTIFYKVTKKEFYGYTPLLKLKTPDNELDYEDAVDPDILKMSDLSWDEAQLILYYRKHGNHDEIIQQILKNEE